MAVFRHPATDVRNAACGPFFLPADCFRLVQPEARHE